LAALYGVTTKRFNEAVKRNLGCFPVDFCFVVEDQDVAILRSQLGDLKIGCGGMGRQAISTSGFHRTRGDHGGDDSQ